MKLIFRCCLALKVKQLLNPATIWRSYRKAKRRTPMKSRLLFSFSLCFLFNTVMASERISISDFSTGGLEGWQSKSFAGETDYQLVEENGTTVLLANSRASASGLGKKMRIDLNKTPYLNWSWKVNTTLQGLDETTKAGDDYVARIYVVKSGGALLWKTKALNYVWSGNQERGATWKNAFQPKNAVMLAARGRSDAPGQWITEKRNVREDLKNAFGKDFNRVDAIAIMTDTDNSSGEASAYYGEIFFTAQ